jgi:hypothetical protein
MRRSILLLLAAVVGLVSGLITAFDLVPRVRLVEVVTLFFSAFGAGATMVGAIIEIRKSRRLPPAPRPPQRA